ncbi:ROK family protein [Knoellia subterranea]|uniref:ROK family protein n=1 Tax=Knoellia subterranea TaxID=184882 RepID=UPI000A03FB23|nr:ROK family protein [Knoellia subterranea]
MSDREVVAAIDIGGTKTAAALVDRSGEILARAAAPTPGREGAAAILATAAGLVRDLSADAQGVTVRALGIGSAGVIDPLAGRVVGSTDVLAGWTGTPIVDRLATLTGLPASVINDVHAHALGEAAYGAAQGFSTVLVVGVGTGVGGAFVEDGRVRPGAHSAAGHVGHLSSVYAGSLPCSCGRVGHLEAIASGPGLHAEYQRRSGEHVADFRAVVALAAGGDAHALDVVELGGAAVGTVVGGLVNVLDPHAVVIGGGVAGAGDRWWDALRRAVRRDVMPSLADTPILISTLGGDAPLLGAAALAWQGDGLTSPATIPDPEVIS